ncbi:serine/threonine protein kinase [Candidatus Sumerlaeota bacterium]|nr:serine/threonine protein kinase [Candidatus Sumerlaeota bacterium]
MSGIARIASEAGFEAVQKPLSISGIDPVQLTCHKCKHTWDEEVDDSQPMVQCPECMVVVPIALAKSGAGAGSPGGGAKAAAPPKPAPAPPPKPAASTSGRAAPPPPSKPAAPKPASSPRPPVPPPREPDFDSMKTAASAKNEREMKTLIEQMKTAGDPEPNVSEKTVITPRAEQLEKTVLTPRPEQQAKTILETRSEQQARTVIEARPEQLQKTLVTPSAAGGGLTCNKCGHPWEEDVAPELTVVQCPECMAIVPILVARKGGGAPKAKPSPAAAKPAPAKPKPPVPEFEKTPPPPPRAPLASKPVPERKHKDDRTIPMPGLAVVSDDTKTFIPSRPADKPRQAAPAARGAEPDMSDELTFVPGGGEQQVPRKAKVSDPLDPAFFEQTGGPPPPKPRARKPVIADEDLEGVPDWMKGAPEPKSAEETPTIMKDDLAGLPMKTLAGYDLIKKLGEGGMGMVFLARQISLDRKVALKVLPSRLAGNPEFLMRFTREALSAAQLSHHNIVQVHDVGSDKNVHFISMEYVEGKNLGDMVREDGKLDIETAAGFILQAARGLKYSHERGIVHRDIKPDNMMVNEQGILKIADMGLAKMSNLEEKSTVAGATRDRTLHRQARGDLTQMDIAMGTPAYMPPEQARDASSVDHRADQYSLGCTFYYLCAGKTPFSGASAMEIISKHIADPLPPLQQHVRNVPNAVNAIITRMTAKDPKDRYPHMGEVMKDLEAYLGVESEKGPYSPREQDAELLDFEQYAYNGAPMAKKRKLVALAYFVVMTVAILALVFTRQLLYAGAVLGLMALTPAANFLMDGLMNKTFLFRRVRSVFFGMTLSGWAWTASLLTLTGGLFWIFRPVSYYWVGFAFVAAGLAALYQKFIIAPLKAQRAEPFKNISEMLKRLRLRGVSEDTLQDFIYRYTSEHWEELFEELFGYGPMILARYKWAAVDQIKPRKRFAVWRDPIFRWLDEIEEARRKRRDKNELAKVEADRLKAKGMDEKAAQRKAKETAQQIISEGKLVPTVTLLTATGGKGEASVVIKTQQKRPDLMLSLDNRAVFLLFQFIQFVRLFGGLALIAAFVLKSFNIYEIPIPPLLASVKGALFSQSALIAGIALFLSAFSKGKLMPNLVLASAILLIGLEPLVGLVNKPEFTPTTGTYAAYGGMAIGLFMCVIDKMTGGEY